MEIGEKVQIFQEFLEKYYQKELTEVIAKGKKSIKINFKDIAEYNIEIADELLEEPDEIIKIGELAISKMNLSQKKNKIKTRFYNLPKTNQIPIRNIRTEHLEKLIQVEATVRQKADVQPQATSAKFECPSCGNIIKIIQTEEKFKEPAQCGCGRKGQFKIISKELIDIQKIVIEEPLENIHGGEQPKRFKVLLKRDLVSPMTEKKTNPGSKIIVTGIVKTIPITLRSGSKSTEYDVMIEGNNVESVEEEFSTLQITEEEEKQFKEFANKNNPLKKILESFAPTIYGYNRVKEALLLQLMGGIRKSRSDGVTTRGDMHILLIGDPGAAKSQLLKRVSVIAPKARFVSGKGASGAGLTAAVVKDEFLGGWALEAGALALGNKGIAAIDELDKMTEEDRSAMHEALEQQTITISKANIQATLKSETTVLAAANPKYGRFDPYDSIAKQINMPPALISRFDLIFPIRDVPNKEDDEKISRFILEQHKNVKKADDVELETTFIKKYIAYAKQNISPVITRECLNKIQEYYVKVRSHSYNKDEKKATSIAITPRQLEALIRIAEASARIRLSETADERDAKIAIELLHHTLSQISMDPDTGKLDIDRITSGVTASERNYIHIVREAISKTEKEFGNNIPEEEIVRECEDKGMKEEKIEDVIKQMKNSGDIYSVKNGFITKNR